MSDLKNGEIAKNVNLIQMILKKIWKLNQIQRFLIDINHFIVIYT